MTKEYYQQLVESVKLLSLSYEEQATYFPEYVDIPFEILDTFDKAFILFPQIIDDRLVDFDVIAGVLRLNNFIIFTSSNPILKDLEPTQFSTAKEWNRIRNIAKDVFLLMTK